MMKTFRVDRACDPKRLHQELSNAGIKVITIRAKSANIGEPAMCAVIVVDDSVDLVALAAQVGKHVEKRKPSRNVTGAEREAKFKQMERL